MATPNLSETQKSTQPVCSICRSKKGLGECRNCNTQYCSQCYKTGRTSLTCSKHKITKVHAESVSNPLLNNESSPSVKLSITETETDTKNTKDKQKILSKKVINSFEKKLREASDMLKCEETQNLKRITSFFNDLRLMIDIQEQQYRNRILEVEEKNRNLVINYQNQLKSKQEIFVKRQEELENSIKSSDASKSSEINEQIMSHLKKTAHDLKKTRSPEKIQIFIKEEKDVNESFSAILKEIFLIESKDETNEVSHFDHLKTHGKQSILSSSTPEVNDEKMSPTIVWHSKQKIVAGGNRQGSRVHQLSGPSGLFVDDDKTIYVVDSNNHRIVQWKMGAKRAFIVAGGNCKGSGLHQLNRPYDVIHDKRTNSLIISDNGNLRVVRWACGNRTVSGTVLISNIHCAGLAMDDDGFLYVADEGKHEVRRYEIGEQEGIVVAGGHGAGSRLDQLCAPWYIHIDKDRSLYVSDWGNHRVVKWEKGAKQGILVAGGNGKGNSLEHLPSPEGIVVDESGNVFVADSWNDRVMFWPKGATIGTVIIGRHRVSCPIGLSFDKDKNLYVVDWGNHQIQRFSTCSQV